ncbi:MAG: hemolysin XhlA [Pseudomonadota bacterium]
MEARIQKLENEVASLITDVALIRSNYATKADIAELNAKIVALETNMVKWFIATAFGMSSLMIALTGLAFSAGRYIH